MSSRFGESLAKLWVVQHVRVVLCKLQELLGCGVAGHEGRLVGTLLRALRNCLNDGLVKSTDAITERINLLLEGDAHLSISVAVFFPSD